jgi:hypothetical protein
MKLERYNQIVWAAIGSGTILITLVAAVAFVVSVVSELLSDRSGVPVEVVADGPGGEKARAAVRHDFCLPIPVPGSPYQLIRVGVDRVVVKDRAVVAHLASSDSYDERRYARGCGFYGSSDLETIGNVLVRNVETGVTRPLLAQSALIQAIEYPSGRAEREERRDFPPPGTLYWEIAFADSNGDGRLDEGDDLGAYLSDPDGRNLKRVTPEASRVLEKVYDERRGLLYLKVLREASGDRTLDAADETALVEVHVARRAAVRTVLERSRLAELLRAGATAR